MKPLTLRNCSAGTGALPQTPQAFYKKLDQKFLKHLFTEGVEGETHDIKKLLRRGRGIAPTHQQFGFATLRRTLRFTVFRLVYKKLDQKFLKLPKYI